MESEAAAVPADAEPAPEKKKESWASLARFLFLLFLGALALRALVVAPFSIPSSSMLPRLLVGDYLFVSKWSYGYSRYSFPFGLLGFEGRILGSLPARGDVVVFRYPGKRNEDLVKRVIGLPGDTIEVRQGVVVLNGRPLAREIVNGEADTFSPVTIPDGHVFVMGDNRDDSLDSRFDTARNGVGLLPVENIIGPVMVTIWSTDGSASWVKPWTWFTAARWSRIGRNG
jgi:signal peptidase I